MISYRNATPRDLEYIAANLRPADRRELHAAYGEDVAGAMSGSVERSTICRVALLAGNPITIFGVNPSRDAGVGHPWMVGTPEMEKYARHLLVDGKAFVDAAMYRFNVLFNYVHADNLKSIRWLKRLGFTIRKPAPFGVKGDLFHLFYKNRNVS